MEISTLRISRNLAHRHARGWPRQDWYVDTGDRLTSNRPPGAIFWAVPFYWLSGAEPDQMTLPPASVAASVAVALAVAVLAAVFAAVVDRWLAFWSALLVGLTTPLWGVASDALWQHSVSVLWLALGLLFLSRSRWPVQDSWVDSRSLPGLSLE